MCSWLAFSFGHLRPSAVQEMLLDDELLDLESEEDLDLEALTSRVLGGTFPC